MSLSSLDRKPVILDSDGNVMAFGRLYYYEYNTTTPKAIYEDTGRTVPIDGDPLLLDISGRFEDQPILGSGLYTVKSYRFIGTDPLTDPDDAWVFDHEWIEQGEATAGSSLSGIGTVGTIAELRNLEPDVDNITTLGYYTAGDYKPKTYRWVSDSLALDNGGTVIRNPLYATGAWHLSLDDAYIDASVFGLISGVAGAKNSAISALMTAAGSAGNPNAVFIPRGSYNVSGGSQNVACHLILDDKVKFICDADYSLNILGTFDIRTDETLTGAGSAGKLNLRFNGAIPSQELNSRWWDLALDNVADDGQRLQYALNNIAKEHSLRLDGVAKIATLTADINCLCQIKAYQGAGLRPEAGLTNVIKFHQEKPIDISKAWADPLNVTALFTSTGISAFKFLNAIELRSSWFSNVNSGTYNQLSMNANLEALNVDSVNSGTLFIIDSNTYWTSIGYGLMDKFDFVFETGLLEYSSTGTVHIPSFTAPNGSIPFSGSGAFSVDNGNLNGSWFADFDGAIKSALASGCELDLQGLEFTQSTAIAVSDVKDSGRTLIKNGLITIDQNIDFIDLSDDCQELIFKDVSFAFGSNYPSIIDNSASLNTLTFDNVTVGTTETTNGQLVKNSGTILYLNLLNCKMTYPSLMSSTDYTLGSLNIIGGSFNSSLLAYASQAKLDHANFIGRANKYYKVSSDTPMTVIGCTFKECDLYVMADQNENISGAVVGNTFITSDTKFARVLVSSTAGGALVKDLVIQGNSFTGTLASPTAHIVANGTFANSAYHRMVICDNTGQRLNNVLVPFTKGSFTAIIEMNSYYKLKFSDNPEIFYLPSTPITVNSLLLARFISQWASGAYTGSDQTVTSGVIDLSFANAPDTSLSSMEASGYIDIY